MKMTDMTLNAEQDASRPGQTSTLQWLSVARLLGPFVILLLLVGIAAALSPTIVSLRSMRSIAVDAAPLVVLVMGSALPILIGSIDLSVASVATMTGVAIGLLSPHWGGWGIVATFVAAIAFGACQGFVQARFQVPSFAVTLGTSGVLAGLAQFATGASSVPVEGNLAPLVIAGSSWIGIPVSVLVMLAVWLCLIGAMRYLKLGRRVYAVGLQERAAMMSGIDATALKVVVFAISSGCASIAGILFVSETMFASPTLAQATVLPAVVGVVLSGVAISGGVGTIGLALVGGLTAAFLRVACVAIGLPPTSQDMVYGIVVLIAVAATLDRKKLGMVK